MEGILGSVKSNLYYRIDSPTVLDAAALITYALAVGHMNLEEILVAAGNEEMDMEQFMVGFKGLVKT